MSKLKKISYILTTFALLFANFSVVKAQKLSDSAKIYALVVSPGTELYQAFGHNAFWVVDPVQNINMIYHYGTFDYSTPNFYLKFIHGRLMYMLAIQEYRYFMYEYTTDRRDVWMLKLNLAQAQKQKLFDFLLWQSKDENKYYKYDFFMDNCATRLRFVLEKVFGDSIIFPENKIKLTYRQAIKPYLRTRPWERFGINLLIGLPADKHLNYYSAMFLPDFIDTGLLKTYTIQNGKKIPLVTERRQMIKADFKIGPMPFFNPDLFFWVLSVLLALPIFWNKKLLKLNKTIDVSFYFLTGIVALLMLFMWFFTDHTPTKWNLNLIWANPLNLIFVFYYIKGKKLNLIKNYTLIFSIIYISLVVLYPFFPQQFDTAMIPFFLVFALRQFFIYKNSK